jgi:hypothetical protein
MEVKEGEGEGRKHAFLVTPVLSDSRPARAHTHEDGLRDFGILGTPSNQEPVLSNHGTRREGERRKTWAMAALIADFGREAERRTQCAAVCLLWKSRNSIESTIQFSSCG